MVVSAVVNFARLRVAMAKQGREDGETVRGDYLKLNTYRLSSYFKIDHYCSYSVSEPITTGLQIVIHFDSYPVGVKSR